MDDAANSPEHHHHDFEIFINDQRFTVKRDSLTGAELKKLANKPANYQLFLEHPGHPDQLIGDQQSVEMKDGEHFHTVPPAQFG